MKATIVVTFQRRKKSFKKTMHVTTTKAYPCLPTHALISEEANK